MSSNGNGNVTIVGLLEAGGILGASITDPDGLDLQQVTYRWYVGEQLAGINAQMVLSLLDAGHMVRLTVVYYDALTNLESLEASAGPVVFLDSPPTGTPQGLAPVEEDTPAFIGAGDLLAGIADPDLDFLTVSGLSISNGTLTAVSAGLWSFTPDPDFHGVAEVSYTVADALGGELATGFQLTVLPVNDAPDLDPGQPGSGLVSVDLADGSTDRARVLLQQDDGSVVVAGSAGGEGLGLIRYTAAGGPDHGFGTDGRVLASFGAGESAVHALAQQDDGKLLVVGQLTVDGVDHLAVARLHADGSLDTSFAAGGVFTSRLWGAGATDGARGRAVVLQADGRIVLAGTAEVDGITNVVVVRLHASGALDDSFSSTGYASNGFGDHDTVVAVGLQSDGRIVVAGGSDTGQGEQPTLWRFLCDGLADVSFGSMGTLAAGFGEQGGTLADLEVLDGDRLLLAGTIGTHGAVARTDADGFLDSGFGDDGSGLQLTPLNMQGDEVVHGMTVQADGGIVLSGQVGGQAAVLRFEADGQPKSSWNGSGLVVSPLSGEALGAVVQADGTVLVAAQWSVLDDFVLLRYTPDGNLDTGFGAIHALGNEVTYRQVEGPVLLASRPLTVRDPDLAALYCGLGDYGGATLVLERAGGASADDYFAGLGSLELADGHIWWWSGGYAEDLGSFELQGGRAKLTFGAGVTQAQLDQVLSSIGYGNHSAMPPQQVQVQWTFGDGNAGDEGPGGELTDTGFTTVQIVPRNDAPVVQSLSLAGYVTLGGEGDGPLLWLATDLALDESGRILLAGMDDWGDFAVVRLLPDGRADTGFHGDGKAVLAPGAAQDVWALPGGGVLATGALQAGDGVPVAAVLRWLEDGTPDPTLGGFGYATAAGSEAEAFDLQGARDDQGRIVLAGYADNDGDDDLWIARLLEDGSPDTTFGEEGRRLVHVTDDDDVALDLAAGDDGSVLIVGTSYGLDGDHLFLVRLDASGQLDAGFGNGGRLVFDGLASDYGASLLLHGGRILVTATVFDPHTGRDSIAVLRLMLDGTPDTTFDGDGGLLLDLPRNAMAGALAVQADGSILVAGGLESNEGIGAIVVRLLGDGRLDTSFAGSGMVPVDPLPLSSAMAIELTDQGDIVLGGWGFGGGPAAFVVRLHQDGSLAGDFGQLASATERTVHHVEGGPAAAVLAGLAFSDPELEAKGDYGGARLVLAIDEGWVPGGFVGLGGVAFLANGDVLLDGERVGYHTFDDAIFAIGFAQGTSRAQVNAVAAGIGWRSLSDAPPAQAGISWRFEDGNQDAQGEGGSQAVEGHTAVQVIATNDQPVLRPLQPAGSRWFEYGAGVGSVDAIVETDAGGLVFVGSAGYLQDNHLVLGRLKSDGTFDPDFHGGGLVGLSLGQDTAFRDLFHLPDGDWLAIGGTRSDGHTGFIVARFDADGTFDPHFAGGSPVVTTPLDDAELPWLHRGTVLSDGSIALAVYVPVQDSWQLQVVKLEADGSHAAAFGDGGVVTFGLGRADWAYSIVSQPADDQLLVAGASDAGGGNLDFSVVRLGADGAFDSSFGTDGKALVDFGSGRMDWAKDVLVDGQGRIVLAGRSWDPHLGSDAIAVARLTADGVLDTTFGDGGKVLLPALSGGENIAEAIALQADGRIVLAGFAADGRGSQLVVLRLDDGGRLDETFSGDGIWTLDLPGSSYASEVRVLADGDLLVGGSAMGTGLLVRLNPDGSYDESFGNLAPGAGPVDREVAAIEGMDPVQLLPLLVVQDPELDSLGEGGGDYGGASLTLQRVDGPLDFDAIVGMGPLVLEDGHFFLSGQVLGHYQQLADGLRLVFDTGMTHQVNQVLAQIGYRTDADASPASVQIAWTFGDGNRGSQGIGGEGTASGVTTVQVTGVNDAPSFESVARQGVMAMPGVAGFNGIQGMARQADGKLVVVGETAGDPGQMAIARLHADGRLDTSFEVAPELIARLGSGSAATSVQVLADGRIVVAGDASGFDGHDFAIVRLHADGRADTSFGTEGAVVLCMAAEGVDGARHVAVLDDGSLVVAGDAIADGDRDAVVVRLRPDGSLDTGFGTGGIFSVEAGPEDIAGMAVLPDGRVFIAGFYANGQSQHLSTLLLDAQGQLDTSYGLGHGFMGFLTGQNSAVTAVAVAADGNLLFAGWYDNGSNLEAYVRGVTPAGQVLPGFVLLTPLDSPATDDTFTALTVDAAGRILLAGTVQGESGHGTVVVRLLPNGTKDASFGAAGQVVLPFTDGGSPHAIVVDEQGTITVAGTAEGAGGVQGVLVRLTADGQPDATFGTPVPTHRSIAYTEDGPAAALVSGIDLRDPELDALDGGAGNYGGAWLRFARDAGVSFASVGPAHDDVFVGIDGLVFVDGVACLDGAQVGTYVQDGGALVLTFGDGVSSALADQVLARVGYTSASDLPPAFVTIGWTFGDGNTGAQGLGGELWAWGFTDIAITDSPDAPVVVGGDSGTGLEDGPVTGSLLVFDPDGSQGFSYEVAAQSTGGTASFDGSQWIFVPHADVHGTFVFQVRVTDDEGLWSTADVQVTILPVDDLTQYLGGLSATVAEDGGPVSGTLSFADADGTGHAVVSWGQPAHGTLTRDGLEWTYTPDPDFHGTETIAVLVFDDGSYTSTAAIEIEVTPQQDETVFTGGLSASVAEDGWVSGTLQFTDIDGTDFASVTHGPAQHGTVGVSGASWTYTPDPDYHGSDSFEVFVTDDQGFTSSATVTVAVDPVPDAEDGHASTDEDTPVWIAPLAGHGFENGPMLLDASGAGHGQLNVVGNLVLYTPDEHFHGEDSFTYVVQSGGATETATVVVNVTPVDDPMQFTGGLSGSGDEDVAIRGRVAVEDADGHAAAQFAASHGDHGTVCIDEATGEWTYTPAPDWYGTDWFLVTVRDDEGHAATQTVQVTVEAVPDTVPDAVGTDEDTAVLVDVLGNDGFAGVLALTATHGQFGLVTVVDGQLLYTPNEDRHGTDTIAYYVTTAAGDVEVGELTVTVHPVNDPAVFSSTRISVQEDLAMTSAVFVIDADGLADPLFTVVQAPLHGKVQLDPQTGLWTYTPDADFHGADSFLVTVRDDGGHVEPVEIELDVQGGVDAVPDQAVVAEDGSQELFLLANDTFGNPGRYVAEVTDGAHGTVELLDAATGRVRYTPAAHYHGSDTFSYTVWSGGATETATVCIEVTPQQDETVFTGGLSASVSEDGWVSGTLQFTDIDGTDFASVTHGQAQHGTVGVSGASWTYTPDPHYHGSDSFEVFVTDDQGFTSAATVTIAVTAQPDPMQFIDGTFGSGDEDTPVHGALLVEDADGATTPVFAATHGSYGTVSIDPATGAWTYTPGADWSGADQFQVTVLDDEGHPASVAIQVVVAPAPDTVPDLARLQEDGTLLLDVLANDGFSGGVLLLGFEGAWGSAEPEDGRLRYTARPDFHGEDSFQYVVLTAGGLEYGTVRIVVEEVDDPSTVIDTEFQLWEDTAGTFTLFAQDVEGLDAEPFALVQQAAHGVVELGADGTWTYTPDADFHGHDPFTVSVRDAEGRTTDAVIRLVVHAVGDVSDDHAHVMEDGSIVVSVFDNDDFEGAPQLQAVQATGPGTVQIVDAMAGTVRFTPTADFWGFTTFTYTVATPGGPETATVHVEVLEQDDPAVFTGDFSGSGREDESISGVVGFSDADGTVHAALFTAQGPSHGSVVYAGSTWIYTPDGDWSGDDSFDFGVTDDRGRTSTQRVTVHVTPANDQPQGLVLIAGPAEQGGTLSAQAALTDVDGPGELQYQWFAGAAPIEGATGATLLLTQAQVNQPITVRVRYLDGGGTREEVFSAPTAPVANVNDPATGSIAVLGTPVQGQQLSVDVDVDDADGLGDLSYQWLADGQSIDGAKGPTLALTQQHVGKAISVQVSWIDGHGTPESLTSAALSPVADTNDPPSGAVLVSGTPSLGEVLQATHTLADPDGLGAISWQWLADGHAIAGATTASLGLTEDLVGRSISVEARYVDGFGMPTVVPSAGTGPVGAPDPLQLQGMAYHWRSHVLLDGVQLQAVQTSLSEPDALVEFRDVVLDPATRTITAQVWIDPQAAVANFGFLLRGPEGSQLEFSSSLQGWALASADSGASAIRVAGMRSEGVSGPLQLGTVTLQLAQGATDGGLYLSEVQVGDRHGRPASLLWGTGSSDGEGEFRFESLRSGDYELHAWRSAADARSAINSADALAALRLAVGANPNRDPDGPGPLQAATLSPYQVLAADVNHDGRVTSADALAILRMAVRAPGALAPEWAFVPETLDLWDESLQRSALTRQNAGWDRSLSVDVSGDATLNLVGVLMGDVNGSWTGAAAAADLDVLQPGYFQALADQLGVPVDIWGLAGGGVAG